MVLSAMLTPFEPAHWSAIALTVVVPCGAVWLVRRAFARRPPSRVRLSRFGGGASGLPAAAAEAAALAEEARPRRRAAREKLTRRVGYAIAALLLANRLATHLADYYFGDLSWQRSLPLDPCDLANYFAILALLRPRQWSYELAYFWSLAGSLPAVVMPDTMAFPDPRFFTFFIAHGGAVTAAVYLTLAMRLRPAPVSIARVFGWTVLWLVVAGTADALLGANYGYLCTKPGSATVMDYLGPWPWYIVGLAGVAVAELLLLYAPFFLARRLRRRPPRREAASAAWSGENDRAQGRASPGP